MIKKLGILSLMISLVILLVTGCGSKDLTKGKSPQEIVVASSTAMQDLKSYNFTMDMKMGFPNPETDSIETMEMSGSGETTVNPARAHLKMTTKIMGQEAPMEIYVTMENDKILEYISNPMVPEQWLKMELPMSSEMQDLSNPAKSLEVLKELLVDAKVLREEEENKVKYVVIEATLKPDAVTKFLPSNLPMDMEQLSGMLSAMGNIQYNMWVRKDNLFITKMEVDLGELMKRVLAQTPGIPEEQKALLDKITATMSMTYTDFDKVTEITIPEEVEKNAKDMSELMQLPTE